MEHYMFEWQVICHKEYISIKSELLIDLQKDMT